MKHHSASHGLHAVKKRCCKCRMNVAGRARTKDSHGRYYCAMCLRTQQDQLLREMLAAQMPEPEQWRKVPVEAYIRE